VRTFFTLSVRLMAPALVTIFLFHFVAVRNNFVLPLIALGDQKLFPVTLGLNTWNSQVDQRPELRGLILVGAFLSPAPTIVASFPPAFPRSGLGAGSLNGRTGRSA
jgi:multiple sugar transport system permease protein